MGGTTRRVGAAIIAISAEVWFGGSGAVWAQQAPRPRVVGTPAPGHTAADKGGASEFKYLVFDGFEGKLGLKWDPVRPDPSHVSLTKNPGKLTITTQAGSIHTDEKARNDPPVRNIYLIDNPLAKDADFVVTTCVSGFTPETQYQQAGLIIYEDDDNYLKWGYEYNWPKGEGQAFCILTETDAKSKMEYVESEEGLKRYWVRLTKQGDRYEYASSTDGKDFRVYGEVTWGDGAPKRIGLLAKNGGNEQAGELDAAFEFFELRAPAASPAEAAAGKD